MAKKKNPDARLFPVDTHFQKMARRKGGPSRAKAIAQAEGKIEQARPGFDEWLDAELQEFVSLVKTAEEGQANPDWIERANFRSRQLRDSSTTFGYELLSFIANSLCEILDAMEAGRKGNMESIACHMDAIALARRKSYRRLRPDQVPELTKGLRRVVKRATV